MKRLFPYTTIGECPLKAGKILPTLTIHRMYEKISVAASCPFCLWIFGHLSQRPWYAVVSDCFLHVGVVCSGVMKEMGLGS